VPRWLIKIENDKVFLGVRSPQEIVTFNDFLDLNLPDHVSTNLRLTYIPDKNDYIAIIAKLKEHIQRGDFYEINYCIRWEAEGILNVADVFEHINELSMAPFTCLFRQGHRYMVCASPERFLKMKSQKLIAQPIKGTKARSHVPAQDLYQKETLYNLEKERTENIMIVDLVRNDLSKVAIPGTVKVEELCQVYSFKQVHQMISTVTAQLEDKVQLYDIISATFPMGSMTGAPKQSAAIAIDKYEDFRRDLFSGAIGYITPKRDFDFNVVIRSIFYDSQVQKLKVATGSAITFDCDAEAEYQECLLKAWALLSSMQLG
jgi:para-aminobenzoate synthetase component 1